MYKREQKSVRPLFGLLALVAVSASAVSVSAQQNSPTPTPVIAPHEQSVHLTRAKEALAEGRLVDVTEHLAPLMRRDAADYFLSENGPSLKDEVLRLIRRLDSNQAELWEQILGDQASASLVKALQERSVAQLDRVTYQFAGTAAARKAHIMAARILMDQGQHYAAAVRLQNRREWKHLDGLEPELSVLTAVCWMRAGEERRAKEVLLEVEKQYQPDVVAINGQQTPWFPQLGELDAWMDSHLQTSAVLSSDLSSSFPSFHPLWHVDVAETEKEHSLLSRLDNQFRSSRYASSGSLQPLLLDSTVVMRNAWRMLGVEAIGGRRIWAFPESPSMEHEDDLVIEAKGKTLLTETGRTIQRRVWADQLYGQVAFDSGRMYFLDQMEFQYGQAAASVGIRQFRSTRNTQNPLGSRLVALDRQREGARNWLLGDQDWDEQEFGTALFQSPPVSDGNEVYVLADRGNGQQSGVTSLLCLDATTGQLQWEQPLQSKETNEPDMIGQLRGGRIILADTIVICWTVDNMLFGVERHSGRFAWKKQLDSGGEIFIYPDNQNRMFRDTSQNQFSSFVEQLTPGDRWFDPGCLVQAPYCILTPDNSSTLICLNTYTGQIVWTRARKDFLYAACIHQDAVLLVGENRLALVKLQDGSSAWGDTFYVNLESYGAPSGRGVLVDNFYVLTTDDGDLISVRLADGQMKRQSFGYGLGNLAYENGFLVSQSPTQLVGFTSDEQVWADSTLAVSTNNPAASEDERIALLVEQLGAVRFQDREAAEQDLIVLGDVAAEALRTAADGPNLEVRIRARRILKIMGQDALSRRIAQFMEDPDAANLAGWTQFREWFGNDTAQRSFFAEMYKAESRLLDTLQNSPDRITTVANKRCGDIQQLMRIQQPFQLEPATTATLIFLLLQPPAQNDSRLMQMTASFCNSTPMNFNGAEGEIQKALLVKLLQQNKESSDQSLANLAYRFNLPEGYPIAVNILNSDINGYSKNLAFMLLDKFGGKQDIPLLKKLLKDESVVRNYNRAGKRYILQVRDISLIFLLRLSGLDPKENGFPKYNGQANLMSNYELGFETDEERKQVYQQCEKAIAEKEAEQEQTGEPSESNPGSTPEDEPAEATLEQENEDTIFPDGAPDFGLFLDDTF
ncbi:MAG: PQQ-binding-like beta-propeller repeat protein [Pirellulaceae bacterium]